MYELSMPGVKGRYDICTLLSRVNSTTFGWKDNAYCPINRHCPHANMYEDRADSVIQSRSPGTNRTPFHKLVFQPTKTDGLAI